MSIEDFVRRGQAAQAAVDSLTGSAPAYYIATVWFSAGPDDAGERQLVRLPAVSEAAYRAALIALWPDKVLSFGPVSLSKVQA